MVVRHLKEIGHHRPSGTVHNDDASNPLPSGVVKREHPREAHINQKVHNPGLVNQECIKGEGNGGPTEDERGIPGLEAMEGSLLLLGVEAEKGEWLPHIMVKGVVVGVQVVRSLVVLNPALGVDGPDGLEKVKER